MRIWFRGPADRNFALWHYGEELFATDFQDREHLPQYGADRLKSPRRTSREYPDRPLVGVGALVLRDNSIVLVRRGSPPSKGEWSIPGGLVEVGETLKEAVARETREETGLEVEPGDLVELLERVFLDEEGRVHYHFVLADYLCIVRGGTLAAGSDVLEAVWVEKGEAERMPLADVTRKVIMKAFSWPLAPNER